MMDTILPCPFCGLAEFADIDRKNKPPVLYHPYVPNCPASNRAWSIEKWNHRPQPSAPVQPNPIGANMLPHGSPFAVPVQPVVTAYAIIYEDPDRQHEVFMGDDAAVSATKRFALISDRWNAHLFERVPFGDNTVEGFVVPASPSAQPQPEEAASGVVDLIIRDVCELEGYTSPDDKPDLLRCTGEELRNILEQHLKSAPEPSVAAEATREAAVNLVCNSLNQHSRELGGAGMIQEAQDYADTAALIRRFFGDNK